MTEEELKMFQEILDNTKSVEEKLFCHYKKMCYEATKIHDFKYYFVEDSPFDRDKRFREGFIAGLRMMNAISSFRL